jgi:hypothetical protein
MAEAANRYTPIDQRRTLDDVVRYFTEQLGYEKDDPALRWKIWEQFLAGRLKLERHWKKYLRPEGGEYVWASEVVRPSHYRSHSALDSLDFDQHGHLSFVGDPRYYTLVEPCDFRAIWPPPAAEAAPVPTEGVEADGNAAASSTPALEQISTGDRLADVAAMSTVIESDAATQIAEEIDDAALPPGEARVNAALRLLEKEKGTAFYTFRASKRLQLVKEQR